MASEAAEQEAAALKIQAIKKGSEARNEVSRSLRKVMMRMI